MTEDRRCGTCRHYQPTRNPDTGRVLPSRAGKCTYEIKWPELPICYDRHTVEWPRRDKVWSSTSVKCAFWETEEAHKKRVADAAIRKSIRKQMGW